MSRRTHRIERHARFRAKQRYDNTVSPIIFNKVARAIRKAIKEMGRHVHVAGTDRPALVKAQRMNPPSLQGRAMWRVTIEEGTFFVVYEAPTRTLVTFLPPQGATALRAK